MGPFRSKKALMVKNGTHAITSAVFNQRNHLYLRGRLGQLSSTQERAIESLTHGIIDQILHSPITILKAASEDDDSPAIIETVHRIFNLEPQLRLAGRR